MRLSVLVVTPGYPAPDNPQAAVFVHRQIQQLIRQGVTCRVLTFRAGPPPFPRWLVRRSWLRYFWHARRWPKIIDGVPCETVFYEAPQSRSADVVPAISEALIRFIESQPAYRDTQLIYAHWLWTGGAVALRLREHFGWPVAAIARGSELHDWHATRPTCKPHVQEVLRSSDRVLANCDDLRQRALRLADGPPPVIEVIYNGCDATRFHPAGDRAAVRNELGLDMSAKLLLFCGDIIARKGISELTEAWTSFIHRHPAWRLLLVGKPVEKPLLSRILAEGRGTVSFAGPQPHERVIQYMQAADAFVQPSRLEGLANATMEAMATGLPVISTDTCGQRELIEDGKNGWLVPSSDAASLSRALAELAADEERAIVLGRAARETILTRFNPEREAARLARLLRETAGQRSVVENNEVRSAL